MDQALSMLLLQSVPNSSMDSPHHFHKSMTFNFIGHYFSSNHQFIFGYSKKKIYTLYADTVNKETVIKLKRITSSERVCESIKF